MLGETSESDKEDRSPRGRDSPGELDRPAASSYDSTLMALFEQGIYRQLLNLSGRLTRTLSPWCGDLRMSAKMTFRNIL